MKSVKPGSARRRTGLLVLVLTLLPAAALALPRFDDVRRDFRPSDVQVLDQGGALVQRVRTDASVRRGQWIGLADVSPALRHALIYSEDQRFYEHSGVDWRAVSAAAWGNLWNTRTRGASTLTMQLAGLLDEDLRRGASGRSLGQKVEQVFGAAQLEREWRKDQILEAYLNLVPFRGELVGIDALSRTLFAKAPHGLDTRESAIAAALVRAPNASAAQVARRACEVLRAMQPAPPPDCESLAFFTQAALQRRAFDASEGIAPHFARQALRQRSGDAPTLRTTLREPLQRTAVEALDRQMRELRGRNVQDGAAVVLDNASGAVLAWVGSSGAHSRAAEVDAVLAPRQPGSTLKPLLYAQAIAERRLTAASLLEDSPAQIATPGGLYIPQNYDRHFKGLVSARTALAASLNVPAVRTLVMVSPDAFARRLQATGLALRESGDYYGYSLALGSAEVNLLALTNAYRMLANGGRYTPTRLLPEAAAEPPRPVLDAGAAFIVGDILSDPNARVRTFGPDSLLATRFWTAVKTGTSKDMRDNWAIGWSQRYTVGVWVGNADGSPMWDVSGTSGAAPVWAELMRQLHQREPSRAPAPPPGVVQQAVRYAAADGSERGTPLEAARSEWFLSGTQQALFTPSAIRAGATDGAARRTARITAPADGTILALDPDIPPRHQRVRLVADGAPSDVQWRLDGRTLARGTAADWLPWPGRHRLELADARGQVLDSIRIEVRGAGVVGPPPRR